MNILIADSSEPFRTALGAALAAEHQVTVCQTGREALEQMQILPPDLLVLDLLLSEMDGFGVMNAAAEQGIAPAVIAVSGFWNDYILEMLQDYGVRYVFTKPCDVPTVADRIRHLCTQLNETVTPSDRNAAISQTLLQLGISTKHKGYRYLREAIYLIANEPELSITKELYPTVATRCGVSSAHVERGIRNAINTAWAKRDSTVWCTILPGNSDTRPSNGNFIYSLADRLILQKRIQPHSNSA